MLLLTAELQRSRLILMAYNKISEDLGNPLGHDIRTVH